MASGDAAVRIEVQFKAHRCLRTRSTWAHCQSCAATCPSGAIDFAREAKPGEPPAFNASRCLHCGACLSSCQHDAFVAKYFSESKATRRIAEQDPDVVRCFLPFGEIAALSSKAKCYQISTCLASLTPGTLFEIAFARPPNSRDGQVRRLLSGKARLAANRLKRQNRPPAFGRMGQAGQSARHERTGPAQGHPRKRSAFTA